MISKFQSMFTNHTFQFLFFVSYNEFITCLHESWVYEILIFSPVQMPSPALRGFWWYGISISGPYGQPGQYIKKSWGPIMSNFRGQFFMFWGSELYFFWKHYSVRTKKLHNKVFFFSELFLIFFWNKTGFFLGLRTFSNVNVLST